jgi:hypothetical protein
MYTEILLKSYIIANNLLIGTPEGFQIDILSICEL